MSAAIITATNITKHYGKKLALDNISFSLPAGRIVGLIGPNGSGKTTLIKALLGLAPFKGELDVLGFDPRTQRDALMHEVSFIADVAILPRWLNVKNAVDFVEGVHPKFSRSKCEAYIANTKLQPNMKVSQMSKGMVVQLHLALVMAIDAKLLVLDEPTLGLDILYRRQFYQNLLEDYFDHNRTILIATHQVEEIENILTDLIFIRDGKLALNASLEEINARFIEVQVAPQNMEVARAQKPIDERTQLGKTTMLFDGVHLGILEKLGECRNSNIVDLFIATMKDTI